MLLGSSFGSSVSISSEGLFLAVGEPSANYEAIGDRTGSVHVYRLDAAGDTV